MQESPKETKEKPVSDSSKKSSQNSPVKKAAQHSASPTKRPTYKSSISPQKRPNSGNKTGVKLIKTVAPKNYKPKTSLADMKEYSTDIFNCLHLMHEDLMLNKLRS